MAKGNIVEVFRSFQGEGDYIGHMQVFIRLAGCKYGCPFCDTDYEARDTFFIEDKEFTNDIEASDLVDEILNTYDDKVHSYSFTGGEPLLQQDFLLECATLLKQKSDKKLFLETSGLHELDINKLDGLFDILSVDVKTFSDEVLSNTPILFKSLVQFNKSSWYLKLLFDENVNNDKIPIIISSLKEYEIDKLILQPIDNKISEMTALKLYDIFYNEGIKIRLIPQTHKILNIR